MERDKERQRETEREMERERCREVERDGERVSGRGTETCETRGETRVRMDRESQRKRRQRKG